jgi:hypothetical protein
MNYDRRTIRNQNGRKELNEELEAASGPDLYLVEAIRKQI